MDCFLLKLNVIKLFPRSREVSKADEWRGPGHGGDGDVQVRGVK